MLNDRGVPNPTEYKRLHGLRYKQPTRKNSTLWKYFAISDMLCNEMYIGNMVQGKYGSVSYKTKQNKPRPKDEWYRVEGTHEAMSNDEETNNLIVFCKTPRTRKEICDYLGLNSVTYAIQTYVNPLVEAGVIKLSIPDKPKSPKQLYYSGEREK